MPNDFSNVAYRYEDARSDVKIITDATQADLDEATDRFRRAEAEVFAERRRYQRELDRATDRLKEALAEQGPKVICAGNYAYFLLDGELHRMPWATGAVTPLDPDFWDNEDENDAHLDDIVIDAQSLGESVIKRKQAADMTGSFAAPKPSSNGAKVDADHLLEDMAAGFESPEG